jgi:integrase
MNRLFNKARLFKMVYFLENPIGLVEVRGISKRRRKPMDLTVKQFYLVRGLLPEPYSDMSFSAVCTGLRVDELLALLWSAVDFERLCMKVEEGVVNGRIGPVKTEYSEDELPLDPDFASFLLDLKRKSNGSELVFPSSVTGRAYHASPIQQDYLRRAGWCLVECPQCGAAPGVVCNDVTEGRGKVRTIPVHDGRRQLATKQGFGSIGWHTFRHTYRSLLSGVKTALDVQQKLMRQAQISTTMQYGGPPMDNQRRANSKVVRSILRRKSAQ